MHFIHISLGYPLWYPFTAFLIRTVSELLDDSNRSNKRNSIETIFLRPQPDRMDLQRAQILGPRISLPSTLRDLANVLTLEQISGQLVNNLEMANFRADRYDRFKLVHRTSYDELRCLQLHYEVLFIVKRGKFQISNFRWFRFTSQQRSVGVPSRGWKYHLGIEGCSCNRRALNDHRGGSISLVQFRSLAQESIRGNRVRIGSEDLMLTEHEIVTSTINKMANWSTQLTRLQLIR